MVDLRHEEYPMDAPESLPTHNPAFPALPRLDTPLPAAFDDKCHVCKIPMRRMDVTTWGRRRPFAIFQCSCNRRLFLVQVEGEKTPLFIWSDDFGWKCINFSDFVDEKIKEHKENQLRRDARDRVASAPSETGRSSDEFQLSLPFE